MRSLQLGRSTRRDRALRVFNAEAERIVVGVTRRPERSPAGTPPTDTRNGFLKIRAYRLVRRFLRCGHGAVISKLVEDERNVPTRGPTFEDNPFFWGLIALASDRFIKPHERWLFSKQMLLAYHRRVRPKYLIGFLYQTGSQQRQLAALEEIEKSGARVITPD